MKKDQKSMKADSDGEGISEADWKAMMEHKTTIRLSPKDWERFCALLEAPPKPNEALKQLMNRPSIFDDGS